MASWRSARSALRTVSSMVSWRSAASRVTRAWVSRLIRIVVVSDMAQGYGTVDKCFYSTATLVLEAERPSA